ncbi:hypothetical protein HanRHA438_Chr08g0336081 [Helianthus annuus]|nr:hypothetical protein HanRHA438_Chr08g0336081 [Helianthus annuus]
MSEVRVYVVPYKDELNVESSKSMWCPKGGLLFKKNIKKIHIIYNLKEESRWNFPPTSSTLDICPFNLILFLYFLNLLKSQF